MKKTNNNKIETKTKISSKKKKFNLALIIAAVFFVIAVLLTLFFLNKKNDSNYKQAINNFLNLKTFTDKLTISGNDKTLYYTIDVNRDSKLQSVLSESEGLEYNNSITYVLDFNKNNVYTIKPYSSQLNNTAEDINLNNFFDLLTSKKCSSYSSKKCDIQFDIFELESLLNKMSAYDELGIENSLKDSNIKATIVYGDNLETITFKIGDYTIKNEVSNYNSDVEIIVPLIEENNSSDMSGYDLSKVPMALPPADYNN